MPYIYIYIMNYCLSPLFIVPVPVQCCSVLRNFVICGYCIYEACMRSRGHLNALDTCHYYLAYICGCSVDPP